MFFSSDLGVMSWSGTSSNQPLLPANTKRNDLVIEGHLVEAGAEMAVTATLSTDGSTKSATVITAPASNRKMAFGMRTGVKAHPAMTVVFETLRVWSCP